MLGQVVRRLEALGIPYMVAGSLASSFHGRPQELSAAGYYVDLDRARDALRRKRQFNVIEGTSAFKLDLIIRKDRPFRAAGHGRAPWHTIPWFLLEDPETEAEWLQRLGRQ